MNSDSSSSSSSTSARLPVGITHALAFVNTTRLAKQQLQLQNQHLALTDAEHKQMFAWLTDAYDECEMDTSVSVCRGFTGLLLDAIVCANLTREIAVGLLHALVQRVATHVASCFVWTYHSDDIRRLDEQFDHTNFASVEYHTCDRRDQIALCAMLVLPFHADAARSLDLFQRFTLSLVHALPVDSPVFDTNAPLTDAVIRTLDRGPSHYAHVRYIGPDLIHEFGRRIQPVTMYSEPRDDVHAKLRWLLSCDSPLRTRWLDEDAHQLQAGHSAYGPEIRDAMLCDGLDQRGLVEMAWSSYDRDPERGNGRFMRNLRERFPGYAGTRVYRELVVALTRGQHARVLSPDLVASVAAFLRQPDDPSIARRSMDDEYWSDEAFHCMVATETAGVHARLDMLAARRANPGRTAILDSDARIRDRLAHLASADAQGQSASQQRHAVNRRHLNFLVHGILTRDADACGAGWTQEADADAMLDAADAADARTR